ncbi:hypothetical protein HK096_009819, partial [Nowakowskiella sp. JEL0078]
MESSKLLQVEDNQVNAGPQTQNTFDYTEYLQRYPSLPHSPVQPQEEIFFGFSEKTLFSTQPPDTTTLIHSGYSIDNKNLQWINTSPSMFSKTQDVQRGEITRKKRRRTTQEQLQVLEAVFLKNSMPSTEVRDRLARETSLPTRTVQVWFQNRRQTARKRNEQIPVFKVEQETSDSTLKSTNLPNRKRIRGKSYPLMEAEVLLETETEYSNNTVDNNNESFPTSNHPKLKKSFSEPIVTSQKRERLSELRNNSDVKFTIQNS